MITKTEQVKDLVQKGDITKALRIAKDFRKTYNITAEEIGKLRSGWDALQNPEFYKQIGKDVDLIVKEAIDILNKVYGKEVE